MEFLYKHANLPNDQELLIKINRAAGRLYDKLKPLDAATLTLSDYTKKYLSSHITNLYSALQKYSYILAWSLAYSNVGLDDFVFLEYGGGTGILSLLAKELGIGFVVYNDIYGTSCKDAAFIGEFIGNKADYYHNGDFDDLVEFIGEKSISCNGIASYDVIEHVYDIEKLFSSLNLLTAGSFTVFMASGANMFNPIKRRVIIKKHLECEFKGSLKKWGHKERDSLTAYFAIRKEIILNYNNDLSASEIEKLAKATRGMIKSDIVKCIDEYLNTKHFPKEPAHPTNTCDPYTGNWAEHLINPYRLKQILSKNGFKADIFWGHYGKPRSMLKKLAANWLNLAIYIGRKQGRIFAPFYAVYGIRQ